MTPQREGPAPGALLTDLYELTMAQSYFDEGVHERPATFSLFTRTLPRGWGYLVAAGLDDVLAYLESLSFDGDDLAYLEETRLFTSRFLGYLAELRFAGDVRAMPEGTLFFAGEPVLELTGPMVQAQLVETVVLQEVHFQSLVAGKAARCVDAAGATPLVDFGLRRTHRAGAGMRAARSSWLAGFDATSNVLAGSVYGIPVAGTMAHSYVESFEDELEAFRAYARAYPDAAILLVDTYDTLAGARRAVTVARELAARGHRLHGVRLDSGGLDELSRAVRSLLDEAGFEDAMIFASGALDEHDVARLRRAGAPIGGFGIGSKLGTSADSPFLDMAYKLVEFDGRPTLKLSGAKATLPGAKQVWRLTRDGAFARDVVGLAGEEPPPAGEPLLELAMEGGRRRRDEPLAAIRERCAAQRERLPARHRSLGAEPYAVELSAALGDLRDRSAADARRRHGLLEADGTSRPART
jgi:nicotinate phosphoribosyltransferase